MGRQRKKDLTLLLYDLKIGAKGYIDASAPLRGENGRLEIYRAAPLHKRRLYAGLAPVRRLSSTRFEVRLTYGWEPLYFSK